MTNHQNGLEQYLLKDSLFKTSKPSSLFLSHNRYVEPERPTSQTQYKPSPSQTQYKPSPSQTQHKPSRTQLQPSQSSKLEETPVKMTVQNKRSDKRIGMNLDQIEDLQKSLNGEEGLPSMYSRSEERREEPYRPYFASRVVPRPLPQTNFKRPEQEPIIISGEDSANKDLPEIGDSKGGREVPVPIVSPQQFNAKSVDEKINIWVNKSNEATELSEFNMGAGYEPAGEYENKMMRMDSPQNQIGFKRTDSNMMLDSFGKNPAEVLNYHSRHENGPERSKQSPQKEQSLANTSYKKGSRYFEAINSSKLKANASTILISPGSRERNIQEQLSNQQTFFNSTKRDTSRYIDKISSQLKKAYASLDIIQKQIDKTVEANLDIECDKMRSNLYKVIDAELKEFKRIEISKLSTAKLTYMPDLYEIKCNIELRLAELDTYRSTLGSEMKWKSVISNILTPDYESTLLFVFSKAEEIEEDSTHYSKSFLQEYSHKMTKEVHQPFKREMKLAIESLFCRFGKSREQKLKGSLQPTFLGDNPRISDLNYS